MVRREALRAVGGYREAFAGAEDHDLYLRLAERGLLSAVDEIVLDYRLHAGQISRQKRYQGHLASVAAVHCARIRRSGGTDPVEKEGSNPSLVALGLELLGNLAAHAGSPHKDTKLAMRCASALIALGHEPDTARAWLRRRAGHMARTGHWRRAFKLVRASLARRTAE